MASSSVVRDPASCTTKEDEECWIYPKRWTAGDKVAVVAPSSGCAAIFPHIRDLGIRRLRECFHVEPVLYPTMLKLNNTDQERATDVMNAFADDSIKGIVCSIGGDDSIRMLPLLDTKVIRRNPKILLGFSDITSLHLVLFKLKIVSFYGGNLLCQFGLSGPSMHSFTLHNFQKVLLLKQEGTDDNSDNEKTKWAESKEKLDAYLPWEDESKVDTAAPMTPNEGWVWAKAGTSGGDDGDTTAPVASGRLWGGCLETLYGHLVVRRYLPDELLNTNQSNNNSDNDENKLVLFVETSEVMPPSHEVYTFFQSLGELNLLRRFAAVLMGRPKIKTHLGEGPVGGAQAFVQDQQAAVLRAFKEYHAAPGDASIPIVFNVDFGHTDPQLLVPSGALVEIDTTNETITTINSPTPR